MQQQCNFGDTVPVIVSASDLKGASVSLTGFTCTLVVSGQGARKSYAMTVSPDGSSASATIATATDLPGIGDYAMQFVGASISQSFSSVNPLNLKVGARL